MEVGDREDVWTTEPVQQHVQGGHQRRRAQHRLDGAQLGALRRPATILLTIAITTCQLLLNKV